MAQHASRPLTFDKVREDANMQAFCHGSQLLKAQAMVAEKFAVHHEAREALVLSVAGVTAIMLTAYLLLLILY
jgi:hypothetical protein